MVFRPVRVHRCRCRSNSLEISMNSFYREFYIGFLAKWKIINHVVCQTWVGLWSSYSVNLLYWWVLQILKIWSSNSFSMLSYRIFVFWSGIFSERLCKLLNRIIDFWGWNSCKNGSTYRNVHEKSSKILIDLQPGTHEVSKFQIWKKSEQFYFFNSRDIALRKWAKMSPKTRISDIP